MKRDKVQKHASFGNIKTNSHVAANNAHNNSGSNSNYNSSSQKKNITGEGNLASKKRSIVLKDQRRNTQSNKEFKDSVCEARKSKVDFGEFKSRVSQNVKLCFERKKMY